jgi:hypothetical protein
MNIVGRDTGRYFGNKMREYVKHKVDEVETNRTKLFEDCSQAQANLNIGDI